MTRDVVAECNKIIAAQAAEIKQLREEAQFLECLRAAGVDNWEGYSYAIDMFRGES